MRQTYLVIDVDRSSGSARALLRVGSSWGGYSGMLLLSTELDALIADLQEVRNKILALNRPKFNIRNLT